MSLLELAPNNSCTPLRCYRSPKSGTLSSTGVFTPAPAAVSHGAAWPCGLGGDVRAAERRLTLLGVCHHVCHQSPNCLHPCPRGERSAARGQLPRRLGCGDGFDPPHGACLRGTTLRVCHCLMMHTTPSLHHRCCGADMPMAWTSGGDAGAIPLEDGHPDHGHRPEQERRVTDQGVRHITHVRVRSQWREEREVPLKRPVEPAAEEIIPGREAGQPHDARGIAQRIHHDHQTGAEIAERHEAAANSHPRGTPRVPRWERTTSWVNVLLREDACTPARGISCPAPSGWWDRSPIPPTSRRSSRPSDTRGAGGSSRTPRSAGRFGSAR